MKESAYKSYGELPLFLNAKLIAQVLGISPSSGVVGIATFGCDRWLKVGNAERKAPDFGLSRGGFLRWFWGVLTGIKLNPRKRTAS